MTQRIGILTGGGDVPGLNSVIKSVVYRASELGYEVIGIRRGWKGLTHMRPGPELDPDYIRPLDRRSTRAIDRTGGTVLHTSRTNPARMKEASLPEHLDADRRASMQTGEGPTTSPRSSWRTSSGSTFTGWWPSVATTRWATGIGSGAEGVPLMAIPKTMDNDVQGTEYCIGFSSAVTRARELINRQRTTLGSHERIGVFRIFGRNSGYTAWYAAYVTSGRCVIPESSFDLDQLAGLMMEDRSANPSGYAFVIASEGAIWSGGTLGEEGEADSFGHRHKSDVGHALALELRRRTGVETVNSDLTYDLRSGDPDALDQMVATTFANVAMDLLADDVSGRMSAIRDGKYSHAPLPDPALGPRKIDVGIMYNLERLRPQYGGKLGSPLLLGPPLTDRPSDR